MQKTIEIPAVAASTIVRKILRMAITPDVGVEVSTMDYTVDGVLIPESSRARFFSGDQYAALLEANPVWSPNKPGGVFRPEDIFALMEHLEL